MALEYEILGDDMQAVAFRLRNGQKVLAEAGSMLYMGDTIKMQTTTGGGVVKGLKRMMSGEGFFIPHFECIGQSGEVAFSGPFPGKIHCVEVNPERKMLCQKDSFLCSGPDVDISIGFTKRLGAGFFGGEGFILQKLAGNGQVFLHAGGTIVERMLSPGQELRVDTGCLVAFDASVDYDIKFIGGIRNALFGGEGIFLARMRGPGNVILQTLPFSRLADRVMIASKIARGQVGGTRGKMGGDKGF